MTLNHYAAETRLAIFEDLRTGREPREGTFDAGLLREARTKASPQMGATRYSPDEIAFEFIFPDPLGAALILTVNVVPKERIVFLPVPPWVVENIWQGDVAGSHHFESDAIRLVSEFTGELAADANRKWFDRQPPKRRE
jgi:hypothetical protein